MGSRAVWLVLAAVACPAAAQAPTTARQTTPSPTPAPQTQTRPDPVIKRTVIEDDQVRIEELKVRGQVQRITISPKASGVRPYEIAPPDSGRDPSQPSKGISGRSLWQLFSF
ncbi:MAG TPA: hypothetical protein VFK10_14240 [Burkholderiaceae bacterium]|nr:hypothetical protein [Burkholderiaceae bacterium]